MLAALRIPRRVEPEILDRLPACDAQAMRSRRDLRRINRAMGSRAILCRAIDLALGSRTPRRIVELGAGDASLLLRVARASRWARVEAVVVDQHDLISEGTRAGFAALGWKLDVVIGDALDWLHSAGGDSHDLALSNLFLHHFECDALERMLAGIAARAHAFVACEPRRAPAALVVSRLVGCLGCNAVTRSDAASSVRAGFRDAELSALWPRSRSWRIAEYAAGPFAHCFAASRWP